MNRLIVATAFLVFTVVCAVELTHAIDHQPLADPEIHLIPEGFTGPVAIVFRAIDGEPAATEDGARLYRIPADGILLTQAEPNIGISPAWHFFLVAASGERTGDPDLGESNDHRRVGEKVVRAFVCR